MIQRKGFCKGCESCIKPCSKNIRKSLEQMIYELIEDNPDMPDEINKLENNDETL